MPATYKRLLLRAIPKASTSIPELVPNGDETVFETFDRKAVIIVLRGGGRGFTPDEGLVGLKDIVQVAHEATGRDVVGLYLTDGFELEAYEVSEEAPDAFDMMTSEEEKC